MHKPDLFDIVGIMLLILVFAAFMLVGVFLFGDGELKSQSLLSDCNDSDPDYFECVLVDDQTGKPYVHQMAVFPTFDYADFMTNQRDEVFAVLFRRAPDEVSAAAIAALELRLDRIYASLDQNESVTGESSILIDLLRWWRARWNTGH